MTGWFFRCRVFLPGQVAGLSQVVREFFFGVGASLPDGVHLLGGQVFAVNKVTGVARGPGSARTRTSFGVFAHVGIVAEHFRQEKRPQFPCNTIPFAESG
jgi:hypothetical protein